jgi:hypothetical protein
MENLELCSDNPIASCVGAIPVDCSDWHRVASIPLCLYCCQGNLFPRLQPVIRPTGRSGMRFSQALCSELPPAVCLAGKEISGHGKAPARSRVPKRADGMSARQSAMDRERKRAAQVSGPGGERIRTRDCIRPPPGPLPFQGLQALPASGFSR